MPFYDKKQNFTIIFLPPSHLSCHLSLSEWDIGTGKCLKTFKHKDPILAARISETYIVSSCERGIVKVWHVVTAQLQKVSSRELALGQEHWGLVQRT